jgi:hypothetical protein
VAMIGNKMDTRERERERERGREVRMLPRWKDFV